MSNLPGFGLFPMFLPVAREITIKASSKASLTWGKSTTGCFAELIDALFDDR